MYLTEHFSLEELTASETAARRGVDNTPTQAIMPNLRFLARQLEVIRKAIGKPVRVNSGFRCPQLNLMVGGSENSAHLKGLAADIISPSFGSPLELCAAVAKLELDYDQVIYEYRSWCHIGFVQTGDTPRKELLTKVSGSPYRKGILDI